MAAGRPSTYNKALCNEVYEIPYDSDLLCGLNSKWRGVKETEWCEFAMGRSAEWLPVIGKGPFDSVRLEYQVSLSKDRSRKTGLPRIDAVGWRDGKATLIEAKVKVTPSSAMGGVGQLLYYEQAVKNYLGWDVEELILLTPSWPSFLVEAVQCNAIPVTLVMATPDNFYCLRAGSKQ